MLSEQAGGVVSSSAGNPRALDHYPGLSFSEWRGLLRRKKGGLDV